MTPANATLWTFIAALFFLLQPAQADQQFQIEIQGYGSSYEDPETLVFDLDNQYTARPKSTGTLSLFPSYKFDADAFQFVGRGSLSASAQESYNYSTETPQDDRTSKVKMDFEEIFAAFTNGRLHLVVGLQTYNWGPAEFASPSQYLVPLRMDSRSSFYREKGLWSARASFTFDRLNITALGEFADSHEPRRRADEKFEGGGYVKAEYLLNKRKNRFVGLTLGHKIQNWAGTYGNWEMGRGFSAYFDGRVLDQAHVYEPTSDSNHNLLFEGHDEQTPTFVVTGLRYEGDFDWRAEYINNSIGWNSANFTDLKNQSTLWQALNLSAILYPGMDLPGQNYFYTSLRKRDFHGWNFLLSNLSSLDDQSQLLFATIEKEVGDAMTLVLQTGTPWVSRDDLANFAWPAFIELGFKAQF